MIRAALCLALLAPLPALARRVPPPPVTDTPTSRMIVEKQLAPQPGRSSRLSGVEARRLHDRYLESIGRPIQPDREERSRSGS